MINHVRTLLLNALPETATFPGEEFVPSTYKVRSMPTVVRKIRQIIFGGNPDRYMLNYRMYELMVALHATELEEYVTYHDSRITYLPFRATSLYSTAYGMTVTPIGTFTGDIAQVGRLLPSELTGRLYYRWQFDVTSGSTVDITQEVPSRLNATDAYTLTAGRSNPIQLPGSSLSVTFSGPVGSKWIIEYLTRPTKTLATIMTTLASGVTGTDELVLFGTNPAEPLKTFMNLWHDHDEYAYKLGGLMLAVAWLMNEQVAA